MNSIEIEIKKISEARTAYLTGLKNIIHQSIVSISPLGILVEKMMQPEYDMSKNDPLISVFYSCIVLFGIENGYNYIHYNSQHTLDANNNYPTPSCEAAFQCLASKNYYSRRIIMTLLNLHGTEAIVAEQAFLSLEKESFSTMWESSVLNQFKLFIREEIFEKTLWEKSVECIRKDGELLTNIDTSVSLFHSMGIEPDLSTLFLIALEKANTSEVKNHIGDLLQRSIPNIPLRLEAAREKVSEVDADEQAILKKYFDSPFYEHLLLSTKIMSKIITEGKFGVFEMMLNKVQDEAMNHNKEYNVEHCLDHMFYSIKKAVSQLDNTEIPESGVNLYRECLGEMNSEDSWLPAYFFDENNLPNFDKNNWIRGILPEIELGLYSKDDKVAGNGRLKMAQMINECARIGIVSGDEISKKKFAYILTGRNVGIPVDEEKPLSMDPECLPFMCYIMNHLFEKGRKGFSPYQQMFDVIDGLGSYHSKAKDAVNSTRELEEQKKRNEQKVSVNYTALAQRAEVFREFAPFLNKIYSFCPATQDVARKAK